MASAMASNYRQDITRTETDFVTVVSVGNNQQPLNIDNFVTVLSIGTVDKNNDSSCDTTTSNGTIIGNNNSDVHPEEEVEVFRLPGEPLGFGLKFEGGAKNAERVKRLFVQSCAEQSPASRAKCSWGSIGEGDEVLSIDGVPVTHMSRLDCVRRLKESQLVIKLLVRCRGALRPEVVSAELKSPHEQQQQQQQQQQNVDGKCEKKIPPELPSVPPPVPPRKLRHARGSGDGEANPIPAKKSWNGGGSPTTSSGSSSQTDSPRMKQQTSQQHVESTRNGNATSDEFATSSKSPGGSPNESFKRSPNERSQEFAKSKQEPPEAMVYLDARSQDGSSTHGSTSDDTGSSMSTVLDRLSMSDRFSTVSTTSTTSGGANDQNTTNDRTNDETTDDIVVSCDVTRLPTFEHLDQDFLTDTSEYLLKRLANSEAFIHVESRDDEAGGVVEKITTVVAPNTVIIEETLTLQPPLSFQDAPLSYGHETRPGLVYTADLAADSTTHFRPIRDEASIVECVNGEEASSITYKSNYENKVSPVAPMLPARNHVNRIPVNQLKDAITSSSLSLECENETHHSREVPLPRESIERGTTTAAPILPPKPMPRKDIKLKRKRPPPPPPPPRIREPPPPVPLRSQSDVAKIHEESISSTITTEDSAELPQTTLADFSSLVTNEKTGILGINESDETSTNDSSEDCSFSPLDSPSKSDDDVRKTRTNKVLEIIEMKKNKAFGDTVRQISTSTLCHEVDNSNVDSPAKNDGFVVLPAPREKKKMLDKTRNATISMDIEDSEESSSSDIWQEAKERQDSSENFTNNSKSSDELEILDVNAADVDESVEKDFAGEKDNDDEEDDDEDDDETYRSLDEIKEDFKCTKTNGTLSESEEDDDDGDDNDEDVGEQASGNAEVEADSTSDDSEDNGDDYYWQSNLATIGEEEETSSLEYTNANKDSNNSDEKSSCPSVDSKTDTTRGCTSEISETLKNSTIGDATKLDCARRINKETASKLDNKLDTQVNGKMENCEGDQRLPPDGDEFPATYQEFSACTSEQYQYVGGSTRLTSRNNNSARKITENLEPVEIDENSSTSSTTTQTTSTKSMKNFNEKIANESVKSLRIESTTKKNSICCNNNNNNNNNSSNNNAISTCRDSREKSSSYVQTKNIKNPQIDNNLSSNYVTSNINREIHQKPELSERNEFTVETKRINASYANNSNAITKNSDIPIIITEKTIEITNYRPKETRSVNYEKITQPRETTKYFHDNQEISDETKTFYEKIDDTDYMENSLPPPLPLTGPPKNITRVSSIGKCMEKLPENTGNNRKYSINSELRRQDDKSEKSVRDKIAMFSSQSTLDTPLFPGQNCSLISSTVPSSPTTTTTMIARNARKLSKYKSSDDVFNDEMLNDDKGEYGKIERTQSFVDLTNCEKFSFNEQTRTMRKDENFQRPPSLPKTLPPDDEKSSSSSIIGNTMRSPVRTEIYQKSIVNAIIVDNTVIDSHVETTKNRLSSRNNVNDDNDNLREQEKITNPVDINRKNLRSGQTSLTRATSFSGESNFINDLTSSSSSSSSAISTIASNGQISRTNSLASTLRRNSEDMRRQSLNQLIEQRRKGISKLRGLVIPEKNAVAIDKPIIDLPEIKSRDSILLHQLPRASIQDKWGSQSSLASNASTASLPMKATTSFKMPAPQIMSKYSPAFKRKSLAVYGSSNSSASIGNNSPLCSASSQIQRGSPTTRSYSTGQTIVDQATKSSLESICSPTRSDYSFDYVTSVSPETMIRNNRSRPVQRKIRMDYDDSDNDSAVSSSQSSMSRGFSPPSSPVPSERSSLSSESTYHSSLIMDVPARHYGNVKDNKIPNCHERIQQSTARPAIVYNDRIYSNNSERSSSGSSSCSSPNPRSPLPEASPRNLSQIPQRQSLKRSSSTETNCSSGSSSTLTSGSQASAESLSRRVLKPQSVEAINRKNILASARCRSGRDLNGGSPLIQRKFSDDEELPISSLARENGNANRRSNNNDTSSFVEMQDVKIAYIEVTEEHDEDEEQQREYTEMREKITENSVTASLLENTTRTDLLEASNDLKMWVRTEAKALMAEMPKSGVEQKRKIVTTLETVSPVRKPRSGSLISPNDEMSSIIRKTWNENMDNLETNEIIDIQRKNSISTAKEKSTTNETISEDLLTTLTTKSRSRAPINLEDRNYERTTRQMSLEDILIGKKNEAKLSRSESTTSEMDCSMKNDHRSMITRVGKLAPATLPRSKNERTSQGDKASWIYEEKSFVSKIPMPGGKFNRSTDLVIVDDNDNDYDDDDDDKLKNVERSRTLSKIPMQRTLGKRSSSVTDMKKAIDKTDSSICTITASIVNVNNEDEKAIVKHSRFPSLDSSVEEQHKTRGCVNETTTEPERFNGEQFGSISSLASTTSLISQQELAQLVEDANGLEDSRGNNHEVIVVLLHKENPHGSVGITLAGGTDCEIKEITVHRVLGHSIADKDGRLQRGDRILSINGRSTRGLSHRESLTVLKQPRSEIVLVVSRTRMDDSARLRSRTESVETIVEGSEISGIFDETAWGPATRVTLFKDGAGLGFSLAGGRDSPLGDRPLVIKKIFTGGAAEKTASLTAGDQLIEVNGNDVTRMSRIEAWSLMKKLSDGEANLLVRHPATKSS